MKIVIFSPKEEFTQQQQKMLAELGEVVYTAERKEYPIEELINISKDADILAIDPDCFGGFEKAQEGRLTALLEAVPDLKGVSLATTSFGWIDLDYCKKRNLVVSNVPYYSTESVAEQTLALLICLAKKIILTDRRTQKGHYSLDRGFELKGKTLGIIGLGHIGSRVAELGRAIGMNVIAYNRSEKMIERVEQKSLDEVLSLADAISIHLEDNQETYHFFSASQIEKMKPGVIVVNLASREIVEEEAMAEALRNKKVGAYAYEGDDLESGPLGNIETALGFKSFAWYTKEALDNAAEIWTKNIISMANGAPENKVV